MTPATPRPDPAALARLAARGVHLGTSSWKYPGWLGQVYSQDRYLTRGKFSGAKFNRGCLAEYAETFPTVCVDAGYYNFPARNYLAGLAAQVPDHFKFSFKVTDEITVRTFPNLARFGQRAGKPNANFLNPDLFLGAFLQPVSELGPKLGVVIFEFSRFHPRDFERGREFLEMLDPFLSRLPERFQFAIETRNPSLLTREYFDLLRAHRVAHVFNQWSRVPPVSEQLRIEGSRTADFVAARFLLKEGRAYQQAVDSFTPYNATKEVNTDARAAAAKLVQESIGTSTMKPGMRPSFIYINNRLEGNAPATIAAILENCS